MDIDWNEVSKAIPYAGIGIVVMVFVWKILGLFKSWMTEREKVWIDQLEIQRNTHTSAMAVQLTAFSSDLKDQRETHESKLAEREVSFREAMTEISAEMKRLADMMASVLTAQTAHDAHSRETWEKLAAYLNQIANGTPKKDSPTGLK